MSTGGPKKDDGSGCSTPFGLMILLVVGLGYWMK